MSDKDKSVSVQIGPGGMTVLTIVFVLLKVYDKIDWSWWWVFAPMWMPVAFVLAVFVIIAVVAVIAAIAD